MHAVQAEPFLDFVVEKRLELVYVINACHFECAFLVEKSY